MNNSKLSPDERVILMDKPLRTEYDEIILTDKDIILYKVKKYLFKEQEEIIKRYPLNKINMSNGKPQVYSKKINFMEYLLNICVGNEIVELRLDEYGKEKTVKWIDSIYQLLTGEESNEESMINSIFNTAKDIGETLGGSLGSFVGNIKNKYNESTNTGANINEIVSRKCISCSAPLSGKINQLVQCPYCGTKQKL